jgi:hypothetical protein
MIKENVFSIAHESALGSASLADMMAAGGTTSESEAHSATSESQSCQVYD